mgnify:CR=1 FL=1
MNGFEQFLYKLQTTFIDVSQPMGWFHCTFLFSCIIICVIIFLFRHKFNEKVIKWFLIAFWIFLVLMEAARETIAAYNSSDPFGGHEWAWRYCWDDFPFQLCSMAIYTLLPAALITTKTKAGRLFKETFLTFCGTFVFFSGAVLTLYPTTIMDGKSRTWYAVYSCMWHMTLTIVGFTLLATRQFKFNVWSFLKGSVLFAITVVLAVSINEIFYYAAYIPALNHAKSLGLDSLTSSVYNMNNFWLSPHFDNILYPIISVFPFPQWYWVPVLLYIIIVSGGCAANVYIAKGCDMLSNYIFVKTDIKCPKCKDHNLVIWRHVGGGSIHCEDFPLCHYTLKDEKKKQEILKKYLKPKAKKHK